MVRVSGAAAAIKSWPWPKDILLQETPFFQEKGVCTSFPRGTSLPCPQPAQTGEDERVSLAAARESLRSSAGCCSTRGSRMPTQQPGSSKHLLPPRPARGSLLGRGNMSSQPTGPGGSTSEEKPLASSPRPLRLGSYGMEE